MDQARVLIVEDEPVVGELLGEILRLQGYDARWTGTGMEGIREYAEWKPQAVILDLMLPDIDGFEICRTVRKLTDVPPAGILMVTGMINAEDRARGFEVGTDRYLTKPFQVQDVIAELEGLLAEYRDCDRSGLRREWDLAFDQPKSCEGQLQSLMVDLARTTPLPGNEIEAFARDMADLGTRIQNWSQNHSASPPWHVTCQVYRDRIVSVLACDAGAPAPGPTDPIHSLFGLPSNESPIPLPKSLADEIRFPDHGSVMVLTRWFSNPAA